MLVEGGLELLSEDECIALLGRAKLGRVGVTIGALPAIFPVNFRLVDGTIVFRTGPGTKLAAALRRAVIAFEVDAIDETYHEGWSVLVVGEAREVDDPELARGLAGQVTPWAPGDRGHVVRIRPTLVSGRRIRHDAVAGAPATGG